MWFTTNTIPTYFENQHKVISIAFCVTYCNLCKWRGITQLVHYFYWIPYTVTIRYWSGAWVGFPKIVVIVFKGENWMKHLSFNKSTMCRSLCTCICTGPTSIHFNSCLRFNMLKDIHVHLACFTVLYNKTHEPTNSEFPKGWLNFIQATGQGLDVNNTSEFHCSNVFCFFVRNSVSLVYMGESRTDRRHTNIMLLGNNSGGQRHKYGLPNWQFC